MNAYGTFHFYGHLWQFELGDKLARITCDTIMTTVGGYQFNQLIISGHDLAALLDNDPETQKRIMQRIKDMKNQPVL